MSVEVDWTQRAMCHWAEVRYGMGGLAPAVASVDFRHDYFGGTPETPGDHSFEVVIEYVDGQRVSHEIEDIHATIRELMVCAGMLAQIGERRVVER